MANFLLPDEEQRLQNNATPRAPRKPTFMLPGEMTPAETAAPVVRAASTVNPDEAGEARRLSRDRGVTLGESALEQLRAEARLGNVRRIMDRSPELSRALSDPGFAKIAHDDAENLDAVAGVVAKANSPQRLLTSTEFAEEVRKTKQSNAHLDWDSARQLTAARFKVDNTPGGVREATAPPSSLSTLAAGVRSAFAEGFAEQTRQGIRRIFGDFFGFDNMAADAARKGQQSQFRQFLATPQPEGLLGDVYMGVQSTAQSAPGMALGLINPAAGLALFGAQTGAPAYQKYRDRGATGIEAITGAVLEGGAEVIFEKMPMDYFVKKFGRVGMTEFIAGMIAREIPTEIATTIAQTATDTAIANPDKTWAQWAGELPENIRQTVISTMVQTGILGGAGVVARRLGAREELVAQTEAEAGALDTLLKFAAASKVRERDATTFQQFLQQAAEDGPVQEVYIDARRFAEAAGENLDVLRQEMPSVGEQIDEAISTGSDLVIPVGEFATKLPGTGLEQTLLDHVRTSPDAPSRAEAQTFMQEAAASMQAQAEKIQQQAQIDDLARQSQDRVEQDLVRQLKEANRFTDDVNTAYAKLVSSFFGTLASRLTKAGQATTAEDMYQRFALRVNAQSVAGEQQLDQTTPEFQQWFEGSKVADADGGWVKEAESYQGMTHAKGEPGYAEAKTLHWLEVSDYPISRLTDATDAGWFKDEQKMWADEGQPQRFDDMLDREIRDPIIVFDDGNGGYIWDGYHRVGATVTGGRKTIKAIVGVRPEQIKSIFNARPTNDPSILKQGTQGFDAWAEGAPVVEADELWQYEGGPAVFKLFHGTTGDFPLFDRSKANPGSDLGAGFYFTNTPEDVSTNYAGEGPDLTSKLEMRAERIESEARDDQELNDRLAVIMGLEPGADLSDIDTGALIEAAKVIAREQLSVEHSGMVLPVFVKVKNPVIIGGNNETVMTFVEEYDEATDTYKEPEGTLLGVIEALREIGSEDDVFEFKAESVISDIFGNNWSGDEIGAADIIAAMKSSEGLMYATDESGVLIGNEIIRRAFEMAGFDAFIDYTVNDKFGDAKPQGKPMVGMDADTVHVIAFEPTQIKSSVGNSGAFDPNSPNILEQSAFGLEQQVPEPLRVIGNAQRATLKTDFSKSGIKDILKRSDWTILTAENPEGVQLDEAANKARMDELRAQLKAMGLQFIDVRGKYGNDENSIVVIGVNRDQAMALGEQFKQQSVLTNAGLVFRDGTINPSRSLNVLERAAEDYYTELPDGTKFSIDIDFDNRWPKQDGRVGEVSVAGVHFSQAKRTYLSAASYGRGAKGAEAERIKNADDKRLAKRVHFYVNTGNGVRAERDVGSVAHATRLANLYDADGDPLGLFRPFEIVEGPDGKKTERKRDLNEREPAVIDAGFSGYLSRNAVGGSAVVFEDVKVTPVGTEADANAMVQGIVPPPPQMTELRKKAMEIQQDQRLSAGARPPIEWVAEFKKYGYDVPIDTAGNDPVYKDELLKKLYQRVYHGSQDFPGPGNTEVRALPYRPFWVAVEKGKAEAYARGGTVSEFELGDVNPADIDSETLVAELLGIYNTDPAILDEFGPWDESTDGPAVDNSYALLNSENVVGHLLDKGYDSVKFTEGGVLTYGLFYPEQVDRVNKLRQGDQARGQITFGNVAETPSTITLLKNADLSTFLHEAGHFYLEVLNSIATQPNAPQEIVDDLNAALAWMGIKGDERVAGGEKGGALEQGAKQTRTAAFKKWFEGSKVVDSNGEPLVLYHGTGADFTKFRRRVGDIGMHFGTTGQANDRMEYLAQRPGAVPDRNAQVMPVYLSIRNPLRLRDVGAWKAENLKSELLDLFPQDTARIGSRGGRDGLRTTADIRAFIQSKGYDGVVYKNTGEVEGSEPYRQAIADAKAALDARFGPGKNSFDVNDQQTPEYVAWRDAQQAYADFRDQAGQDSYIAFRPEQIKSAVGNDGTFDANDPSILSQDGEEGTRGPLPQGRTPLDVWNAMSLEEKRPYHEQWARGFEAYLFEGKAPSVELKGVFSRFAAWLKNVYRQLASLNVELTDEVRGVFDRMLATEEQIKEAEALRGYAPLFKSAEEMGAQPDEWARYQNLHADATESANEKLQTRSLRDMRYLSNARSRAIRELQKDVEAKRKVVEAEVKAEVSQQPIYAVQRWLKYGEMPDGTKTEGAKLDLKALKEMYGEGPAAPWRYFATGKNGLAGLDGVHPDMVAEMFGFSSGDAMVRQILAADPENDVVEGMTDQRMLERYGDVQNPAAIERAADEAVHNTARAKFIATELAALQNAMSVRQDTGRTVTDSRGRTRKITDNVLTKAAKDFATTLVERKKIKDIKPAQFAAAEGRAAKAAERTSNFTEKVTEKRNQLVNHYAARAANDAVDYIEKQVAYLREVGNRESIDPEYRDQINAILEGYELRRITQREEAKRASLLEWIGSQEEMGLDPVIDQKLIDAANRTNYRNLPLEDFRGLVDSIRNIEHLGRLKKKLLTAKDNRELAEVVEEVRASIDENHNREAKVRIETGRGVARIGKMARGFVAMHRKFASIAREMDGGVDGGRMWERLVRPMNEAGDNEITMRAEATDKLAGIFKLLDGIRLTRKSEVLPGVSMTREAQIMLALNWGNEGNRQRVIDGGLDGRRRLTQAEAEQIVFSLSGKEWDFVEAMWDFVGSYRPMIAEQEKRLTGVEPKWVEPAPFTLPNGRQIKGGYFPAKYDGDLSTRSNELEAVTDLRQQMRGAAGRAATRNGYTKERSQEVKDRPLRKDFGVIMQHIGEVTHRLAWQDWLIDARRVLNAKPVDAAIREFYGPEILREMKEHIKDIAAGDLGAQSDLDRILGHIRSGVTIAGMGWNLSTGLMQPLGITQSTVRVGADWMAKGLAHFAANPVKATQIAQERSKFMASRSISLNRDLNDILNKIDKDKLSTVENSYFWFIYKFQTAIDVPTWWGAYERAVAEGNDEARSIALADQAVIDAQGSGTLKDQARIQRGGAGQKLFTAFYSYFNTTYNLAVEQGRTARVKGGLAVPKLVSDYALLFVIPAMAGALLKMLLKGEDFDDEEKLARKLAAEQLNYLFGTMVLTREIGGGIAAALDGFNYNGPAALRLFGEMSKLAQQVDQGEVDAAALKAVNNVAGILLHYPSGQVQRTVEGMVAISEGETQNPAAVMFGPPR